MCQSIKQYRYNIRHGLQLQLQLIFIIIIIIAWQIYNIE